MKKKRQNIDHYIHQNHLEELINFDRKQHHSLKPTDTITGLLKTPFPPEKQDLIRLHQLIRNRKPFIVLEFGVGYSTVIIADALEKNYQEWLKLSSKPLIRLQHQFQLFCVDASTKWINFTRASLPSSLKKRVTFHHSSVSIATHRGQLCHYYDQLPNVVPQFVYVDAPDPKQVKGTIRGLSFKCQDRPVMAADLLLMESSLLPGAFILIDGRTNNARFLERNLERSYKVTWLAKQDVTTFELIEAPVGKYNRELLSLKF